MTDRLRLSGRLDAEGHLTLRPAFPTGIPPEQWHDGPLLHVVEALDAEGRTLTRSLLVARSNCETEAVSLRGTVDVPEQAVRLDVLRLDASGRSAVPLASVDVPARAPDVRLVDVPTGQAEGEFTISWESDAEPGTATYFVDYSIDRETWSPLSMSVTETAYRVDFESLGGGDACRIAVVASIGLRASRTVSEPFQVRAKPCVAVIQRPGDGEQVGPEPQLVGNGWWREEDRAEVDQLAWASDLQGELGYGRQVDARLEPGTHVITLTAGVGDRAGSESVTVHVS